MIQHRRKRACRECRAQKIKCTAEPPQETCERCHRLDLPCVPVPDAYKRQTRARLRRQSEAATAAGSDSPLPTHYPDTVVRIPGNISLSAPSIASRDAPDTASASISRCSPREVDGYQVSSETIIICFSVFFRDYAPFLPIFDENMSPDEYYDACTFLFWTIVFVGSRYSGNPSLMNHLTPRINRLGFMALGSQNGQFDILRGLLLLSSWPVPMNTMFKDTSHTMSGTALHLAMQMGLHVVGTGQDFSRTALPRDTDYASTESRAMLWVSCLITYQCTSLREGILPLVPLDSPLASAPATVDSGILPKTLQIHRQIHDLLLKATAAIVRVLPTASTSSSQELSSFISLYDSQFMELEPISTAKLNSVTLTCYRIHILAYYFFERPRPNHEGLIRLFNVSCKFLATLETEEQDSGLARSCPEFYHRTFFLAAICILKIQRSNLAQHVNCTLGQKAYFSAIYLCQRISLQRNDLGARSATILSQMWTSSYIFRRRDGGFDSLGTKIRSRLSMSVAFDCLWWWREEFDGKLNPYKDQDQTSDAEFPPGQNSTVAPGYSTGNTDELSLIGGIFPDFDWAVSFDFPDGMDWQENSFPDRNDTS